MENYPNYNLNSVAFVAIAFTIWIEKKEKGKARPFWWRGRATRTSEPCTVWQTCGREERRFEPIDSCHISWPPLSRSHPRCSSTPLLLSLSSSSLFSCVASPTTSASLLSGFQTLKNPPPQINMLAAAKPSALSLPSVCVCAGKEFYLFLFSC